MFLATHLVLGPPCALTLGLGCCRPPPHTHTHTHTPAPGSVDVFIRPASVNEGLRGSRALAGSPAFRRALTLSSRLVFVLCRGAVSQGRRSGIQCISGRDGSVLHFGVQTDTPHRQFGGSQQLRSHQCL